MPNDERHGPFFTMETSHGVISSVVYVRGEVDLVNAQEVRRNLEEVAEAMNGDTLLVDLGGLRHLAVRGVASFVAVAEHLASSRRRLVVRNASEAVAEAFRGAGVGPELPVHRDPTEPARAQGSEPPPR